MTTLLIDADTSAYRSAISVERVTEWQDGMVTKHADSNEAIASFEAYVRDMREVYAAKDVKLALTGPANFRKDILPTYKSKRGEKPMALAAVRRHAIEKMGAVIRDRLEADDIVGIWATHPHLIKGPKIVLSIDKDLRSVPCSLTTGDGKVDVVAEGAADYCHMLQTLTGDQTDGYTGLPGCGPKGAAKLLMNFMDDKGGFQTVPAWRAVVAAYEKAGLTEADALVQARVARILRAADFNFKTKEPILWSPPTS